MARPGKVAVAAAAAAGALVPVAGPAGAQVPVGSGAFTVAVSDHTFTDPTRGTPARQGVPASATRTIHELLYRPEGTSGALPTVVFAPGWDNQSSAYDPLLRAIASAGWLVVGVDSPGTSSYFPGAPLSEDLADNTRDLSTALTDVEGGPLGALVDPARVAAVGQSDGGSEVATLALDTSFASTRFSAYAVLSGIVPSGQVPGTFGAVNNGPVLAMVGSADEYGNYTPQAGGGGTQSVARTAGSPAFLTVISGGTHLGPYVGAGTQADDTRAAIVAFLDTAATHAAGWRQAFTSDAATDGLATTGTPGPWWGVPGTVVGMAVTASGDGYWLASADGLVRAFGDAAPLGDLRQSPSPVVAIAGAPDGGGYWLVTADGRVSAYGSAVFQGDLRGVALAAPIVAAAADPATGGYWLLGGDGGVFSFGAPFLGSTGDLRLAAPAVGMAATPDGRGYWFAAADGGVFAFGDAPFDGSMGGRPLNLPVVGLAADPATGGYWLDASDGGIFAFDAPFLGSTGNIRLQSPAVGMAAGGGGYRVVAADGGVFDFSAPFEGSGA
ncbi:MAG TPA: hypothetical protein VFP61_02660 [Acidimicrobiales bacterium]|nr:hypothetical protein [Acidimicrobiales bacterium]